MCAVMTVNNTCSNIHLTYLLKVTKMFSKGSLKSAIQEQDWSHLMCQPVRIKYGIQYSYLHFLITYQMGMQKRHCDQNKHLQKCRQAEKQHVSQTKCRFMRRTVWIPGRQMIKMNIAFDIQSQSQKN